MALILRADVDKPYGHANLPRKIASKVVEDYFPIPFGHYKYLSHLIQFLRYCNENRVPGFMYHRICTRPNAEVVKLLNEGGHKLGFHAENTRSPETFSAELKLFREKVKPLEVTSFTKHGSGTLKLGKYHYPPYEEDKYKAWAPKEHIGFYFGNGICKKAEDLYSVNGFFPSMFWIERDYRDPGFNDLKQLVSCAATKDVVTHPPL
jgi:hypothetical protein